MWRDANALDARLLPDAADGYPSEPLPTPAPIELVPDRATNGLAVEQPPVEPTPS